VGHNPQAQTAIDAAVRAGALYAGASQSDLGVVRVEAREWGDSSLGCPQPGFFYAQVITPGFLVLLTVSGQVGQPARQLEYHTDMRGRAVLCHES
jgi:hypothetical protein